MFQQLRVLCRSRCSGSVREGRRGGVGTPSTSRHAIHVVREVVRVAANAGEWAGPDRVHPVHANEVEPWLWGDAALLERSAVNVEHRGCEPTVVVVVPGRPDDRGNVLASVKGLDLGDFYPILGSRAASTRARIPR